MKFLFFTDVHAKSQNPAGRKDNYLSTVIYKLHQVSIIGNTHHVDFYMCGGDLFDIPSPSNACVTRISRVLRNFEKPIYTVVGSHDHFNYNFETLERSALGILDASGVVYICKETLDFPDSVFYFSHHSNVSQKGVNDFTVTKKFDLSNNKKHVHIIHNSFFDKPIMGEYFLPEEYPNTFMNLVLSGHIHIPFSAKNSDGVVFENPGSLLRVKRNEDHHPSVLVIDTQNLHIQRFEIPHGEDVFKERQEEIDSVSDVDFSSFFTELETADLSNSMNIKNLVSKADFGDDVKNESLSILECVSDEGTTG